MKIPCKRFLAVLLVAVPAIAAAQTSGSEYALRFYGTGVGPPGQLLIALGSGCSAHRDTNDDFDALLAAYRRHHAQLGELVHDSAGLLESEGVLEGESLGRASRARGGG